MIEQFRGDPDLAHEATYAQRFRREVLERDGPS